MKTRVTRCPRPKTFLSFARQLGFSACTLACQRETPCGLPSFSAPGLVRGPVAAGPPDVPPFALALPEIRSGPPVLVFNGKDLTGFYTYLHDHKYEDPDKVFTVRDGMIHISGEEFGGLTTARGVSRLSLITEWKWGERTWLPEGQECPRLGDLAPLRRARRGRGGTLDGVAGMPDHRRGLRRLHHGQPAWRSRA